MKIIDYKEPKLYKDKDNKKWFILYSVKFEGDEKWLPLKEYGKGYYPFTSRNKIADLQEREFQFRKVREAVLNHLKEGKSIKYPETIKSVNEAKIKESKKTAFDENFTLFLRLKGYDNPIPKKERSAEQFKVFYKNQFKPFLQKKGMVNDLTKVSKGDILEFMNAYYLSTDPNIKWSNTTWTLKKALLSSFFQTLVDEDILTENPVKKVKSKPKEATERFKVFSKEERDLLFAHLDKCEYPFLAAAARVIYYSYIRETELTRLKVSDFDLDKRTIRIEANNAKGQKDKLVKWVKMTPQLTDAVRSYLSHFDHQPDWYIFGKKMKPSAFRPSTYWLVLFRRELTALKAEHPKLFTEEGQSLYALKHSGVTDFWYSNIGKYNATTLLGIIQKQCRHETMEMTQRYLKKLEINIEAFDEFVFD
ncbi:tyrosine-type recombinase/integrase [Mucilaginibacter psychrotolerans]|uniref:Tyr recombinase domain-containing protein n=1 Tax=Mucilaginibacter psychrotolerans TaxID=1524096 RepID=A0A4Y8S5Z1_9SPHI|nr:site-specific integrase [Mucilaginibacter psychrotolerans]TFF34413.1 hypothetical protein E2R66_22320 [Mucilaginibacter psychrotolerans]